jgi:hypothetical protein
MNLGDEKDRDNKGEGQTQTLEQFKNIDILPRNYHDLTTAIPSFPLSCYLLINLPILLMASYLQAVGQGK